jgi:CRISPR/Cas system CMR subunit Cmr4 (Cas7 group RAMP superfamily)
MTKNSNPRLDRNLFHIARFVLEADSAFSIGSGLSDGAFDNLVVRDANGLPAIPGTTIAGVLRQLYQEHFDNDDQKTNELFGYAEKEKSSMSRVEFSWGVIHDQNDVPVEQLIPKITDILLEPLTQDHPLYRDRVRINQRGVAADQAKFDVTVIPKGCRFSCEMALWAEESEPSEWNNLLALLHSPMLRMGGSVRSGLGRFKCIRLHQAVFNMKEKDAYEKYCAIDCGLAELKNFKKVELTETGVSGLGLTVDLNAEDFWRFGQGDSPIKVNGKTPDALPLVEPFIQWDNNRATITKRHVVAPGSAVKGALRHRFIFHYRRLVMDRTDAADLVGEAMEQIFGEPHDTSEAGRSTGRAGMVWVDDCYIDTSDGVETAHMPHTSIDRFTGGVRMGMLFLEELIWKLPLKLKIYFDSRCLDVDEKIKQALQWTLEDLINGRLALGAGSAKGHGFFTGKARWTDNGQWVSAVMEGTV